MKLAIAAMNMLYITNAKVMSTTMSGAPLTAKMKTTAAVAIPFGAHSVSIASSPFEKSLNDR